MKYLFGIFIIATFTISCSKQIENFVDVKDPSNTPVTSNDNSIGVKVSGGAQQSEGAQVKTQYSIGFKDREVSGSQVKTRFTISGNRPSL